MRYPTYSCSGKSTSEAAIERPSIVVPVISHVCKYMLQQKPFFVIRLPITLVLY